VEEYLAALPEESRVALEDLRKTRLLVSPAVDAAVLAKAREHLKGRAGSLLPWKPLLPWAAMAASFVVVAWLVHTVTRPAAPAASFVREDINHDGRVDILDAFALARQIESGGTLEARWDINDDGQINRADVGAIAARAVSLGRSEARPARRADFRPARHLPGCSTVPERSRESGLIPFCLSRYKTLSHMRQSFVPAPIWCEEIPL